MCFTPLGCDCALRGKRETVEGFGPEWLLLLKEYRRLAEVFFMPPRAVPRSMKTPSPLEKENFRGVGPWPTTWCGLLIRKPTPARRATLRGRDFQRSNDSVSQGFQHDQSEIILRGLVGGEI